MKIGPLLIGKSTDFEKLKADLKKANNELSVVQKNTPRPSIDALGFGHIGFGFSGPFSGTGTRGANLALIPFYELNVSSPEYRTITTALKREMFRNGFEWEPDFQAKCPQCGKQFDYVAVQCDKCGAVPITPSKQKVDWWEKQFKKKVNDLGQSLKRVLEELEDDANIVDRAFLVLKKQYFFDFAGNMIPKETKVTELLRGSPVFFEPVVDNTARFGHTTEGKVVLVCIEHRNSVYFDDPEQRRTTHCPRCNKKLYKAFFKAVYAAGSSTTNEEVYYIEDEVIMFSKYSSNPLAYWPVANTVYTKVTALLAMDDYINKYYSKQRPPKGVFLVNTRNIAGLQKTWEEVVERYRRDPHYISPIAVDSNSQRGQTAQFIDFMNSLVDMQYTEARNEIRRSIGAVFGVEPIFQNDQSTSGGLNNEGLQVTVTTRAVEAGQQLYNEEVFPKLVKALGIVNWQLKLKPSEEQDEASDEQLALVKTQRAQLMQQLGLKVEEYIEDGSKIDFKFSNKPALPSLPAPSGNGFGTGNPQGALGMPAQGEQPAQRFAGEPQSLQRSVEKAKAPQRLSVNFREKLKAEFEKVLEGLDYSRKPTKQAFKKAIETVIESLRKRLIRRTGKEIEEVYKISIKDVEKELKLSIGFGKVDQNALEVLRSEKVLTDAYEDMSKSLSKELNNVIKLAYQQPEIFTIDKIVDEMKTVSDDEEYRLRRIARTETQRVSTLARQNSYLKADKEGRFLYKWLSVPDARRTELCKTLSEESQDGLSMRELKKRGHELSKQFGFKPHDWTFHVNCRSVFIKTGEQEPTEVKKNFYDGRLEKFGDSAKAVGWINDEVQEKRFEVLSKIFEEDLYPEVLDVGCGLGHFHDYLKANSFHPNYVGIDLSKEFVKKAIDRGVNAATVSLNEWKMPADFVVASGTFNTEGTELLEAIPEMVKLANKGVAFNFLVKGNYSNLRSYAKEEVMVAVRKAGFEPEFIEGYLEGDCTCFVRKEKVYLKPGEKPPKGAIVQTGPEGGHYYNTSGTSDWESPYSPVRTPPEEPKPEAPEKKPVRAVPTDLESKIQRIKDRLKKPETSNQSLKDFLSFIPKEFQPAMTENITNGTPIPEHLQDELFKYFGKNIDFGADYAGTAEKTIFDLQQKERNEIINAKLKSNFKEEQRNYKLLDTPIERFKVESISPQQQKNLDDAWGEFKKKYPTDARRIYSVSVGGKDTAVFTQNLGHVNFKPAILDSKDFIVHSFLHESYHLMRLQRAENLEDFNKLIEDMGAEAYPGAEKYLLWVNSKSPYAPDIKPIKPLSAQERERIYGET